MNKNESRGGPDVDGTDPTPIFDDAVTDRRSQPCSDAASKANEGSLETTTVRFLKNPDICIAPQLITDELLRADGFSEIRYVNQGQSLDLSAKIGRGDADFRFRNLDHPDDRQWRPGHRVG